MRNRLLGVLGATAAVAALLRLLLLSSVSAPPARADEREQAGLAAFEVVRSVLQHPRCANCHIDGDAPLQYDDSRVHGQNVKRGPTGEGAPGFACSSCHGTANPPDSYGAHMPPGAPNWRLPKPEAKMVFHRVSDATLARTLKDPTKTGGKDLAAMLEHLAHDDLVTWGWHPGIGRAPIGVSRDELLAQFKTWIDAGAPVPPEK